MSTLNATRWESLAIPSRSSQPFASSPSSSRIRLSSSPVTSVDRADERARELAAEVGHEVARRAQQAGRRRHDHREGAHHLRHRVRVQRAGAAEGDECEVARVEAALDRDETQRARHVLVDDVEDSLGSLVEVETERVRDLLDRGLGRIDVELHLAAEEPRRQVADDHVRVGHGRLGTTLAVAGRTGLRAGGLGTDAQRAGHLGDVGDRTAAGADRAHVDARHLDRDHLAGQAPAVGTRSALDRRLAVLGERDVGRRPAHVEREDVLVAGAARDVQCARHAARRAREHP